MFREKRWLPGLSLISITCIWGVTFVLVQDAIATLPPFSFLTLRFGLATLVLLLLLPVVRTRKEIALPPIAWPKLILNGFFLGILLFLGYALQTFSLLYTTSGKSGFLTGLSVTMVPLLAWLILRIRPTLITLLGVGIATIGLYLLAFVNISSVNPGDLLAFLCALAFGLQVVYTDKFLTQSSVHTLVVIQLATVTILSALAAILFEPWQRLFHTTILLQGNVLVALIVTALLATSLAYLVQTHVQKYATPTQVALIFASEPVFAALADYLWNGTVLHLHAFLGCVLILGGTLLTELKFPASWLRVFPSDHN